MNLNYGEHILALGKTGAGKTVMLQYLATLYNRSIILDIEQIDGYEYLPTNNKVNSYVVNDPEDIEAILARDKYFRIVVQPTIKNIVGAKVTGLFERLCTIAFQHKVISIFCDEIAFTQPSPLELTPHASAIIMLGRKRYLNFVVSTRRNQEIHKAYITQSNHYFVYRLRPYDVMRYKEYIPDVEQVLRLPNFHCLYVPEYGDSSILKPCPVTVNPVTKQLMENIPVKEVVEGNRPIAKPEPEPEPEPEPRPIPQPINKPKLPKDKDIFDIL